MEVKINMENYRILENSRRAKELAYRALQNAKQGDLEKARELLDKTDACTRKAEEAEARLMQFDMTGREFIREHSRDHLMSSRLSCEIIREMVDQYAAGVLH